MILPAKVCNSSGVTSPRASIALSIDSAWQVQRSLLEQTARGQTAELCESAIDRFAAFYRGHIAVEQQQLLPLAAALLSHAEVAAIGAAMAKRRGVAPTRGCPSGSGRAV